MKPGDKVVMNDNYHVSETNRGKVWTVKSEPLDCCGTLVVKLEGKSGGYVVDGLDLVGEADDPLDLETLREMDGEPVWDTGWEVWGLVDLGLGIVVTRTGNLPLNEAIAQRRLRRRREK